MVQLPDVKRKLQNGFKGKYLLINQTFYNGVQKYGMEFFSNQEDMVRYFGFTCIEMIKEEYRKDDTAYATHTLLVVE